MSGEMMSMGLVVELSGEIVDIEDLTSSSSVLQSSDSSGSLYDYTDEESGGELGENGVQVVAGKPPVSAVEAARKKQKKKRMYAMAIMLITFFTGCGFIAESQDWFGLSFTTSSDATEKDQGGLKRTSALSVDSKPSLTGSKRGTTVPEEDRKTPTSEALEPEAAEVETKDETETKPDPKAKAKIEIVDSAALLRSGTRFQIQIGGSDLCLDDKSDGDSVNGVLSFQKCNAKSASQVFAYDPLNFFLMSKSSLGFCVDSGLISPSSTTPSSSKSAASGLRLYPCSFASAWQQMFEFDSETSVLRSTHLGLCMATSSAGKAAANSKPKKAPIGKKAESQGLVATLSACDPSPDHERLELVSVADTDVNPKHPVLESKDQQFLLRSLGKYNLCLGGTSSKVQVVSCSPSDTNQLFTYSARTHWIQSAADTALCLDDNGNRLTNDNSQQPKSTVTMVPCDAKSSNQRFVYDDFAMVVRSPTKPNLCLDDGGGYLAGESEFRLIQCDLASGNQQFQIVLKSSLFSVPPAAILAFDKAFVVESIYKGLCVDTVENSLSSNDQDDADAFQLRLLPCDSRAPRAKQIFQYDKELQMVRGPTKTGLCWSSSNGRKTSVITTSSTTNFELLQILRLERCDPLSSTQKFVYDAASKVFQSVLNRDLCVDDGGGWFAAETALSLLTCDDGSVHQKFHIRAA